jgi:phage baseplate assembly protein W
VAGVLEDLLPGSDEEVVVTAITPGDLYGRGLSFPVRVGLDGRLAVSEGELNVRECICVLLRTARTERVERPSYGCGLDRFLYESNDLSTLRLLQEDVKRAITTWEPRVALDDVRVAINAVDPRAVDVTVVYNLVASGVPGRVDATVRG